MENNLKDSYIRIRIDKELKNDFSLCLKSQGDTISGYLNRMIVKYVEEHRDRIEELKK